MSGVLADAEVRCPMCGEYCSALAEHCPSCGESRTPSGDEFPKEDRLGKELRALAALWFIVGMILLAGSVLLAPRPVRAVLFEDARESPELWFLAGNPESDLFYSVLALVAGVVMIAVSGLTLQRHVFGIRFGGVFSVPVAIAAVMTCVLFPFAVLLVMGMRQSGRVTKWIAESEAFYAEPQ